jgi:hypothetical protein
MQIAVGISSSSSFFDLYIKEQMGLALTFSYEKFTLKALIDIYEDVEIINC